MKKTAKKSVKKTVKKTAKKTATKGAAKTQTAKKGAAKKQTAKKGAAKKKQTKAAAVRKRPGVLHALAASVTDLREAGVTADEFAASCRNERQQELAAIYSKWLDRLGDLLVHQRARR